MKRKLRHNNKQDKQHKQDKQCKHANGKQPNHVPHNVLLFFSRLLFSPFFPHTFHETRTHNQPPVPDNVISIGWQVILAYQMESPWAILKASRSLCLD